MLEPTAKRLRALRSLTRSRRTPEEAEQLAQLEEQARKDALDAFTVAMQRVVTETIMEPEPSYAEERRILDGLQVDLANEVAGHYLDPLRGQELLIKASGNRVAANAIFRNARRYADLLRSRLERLERLWAHYSPEEVEWRSRAVVAPVLDDYRRAADRAARHADYAEAAFWSLARTCEEIQTLVSMYDMAARLGLSPSGGD